MKCVGCGSNHVNLDETWTKKGSLTRGKWAPFNQTIYEGFQSGNYCSSCLTNNSLAALSWTSIGNVLPRNQTWNKISVKDVTSRYPKCNKENYGLVHKRKPGNYLGINKTWSGQRPYTSG
jgi:hypothetical protein